MIRTTVSFRESSVSKLARLSLVIPLVRALPSRMMTAGSVTDDPSVGQFRSIFSDCDNNIKMRSEKQENDLETVKGGVMVQCVNHATGQNSWKVMPSDYDYNHA